MPGAEMIQGSGYPNMNSDSGCCGSDGGMMQQQNYESVTPAVPQSTMMMSPDSMTMSRTNMTRMSMGQSRNIAPYSSMSRWYSNAGATSQVSNSAYSRSLNVRPGYGTAMTARMPSRSYANTMAMTPALQSSGWTVVPNSQTQMPSHQMIPQQMQTVPTQMTNISPMTAQLMPRQYSPMQSQRQVSPMMGRMMPGPVYSQTMSPGDVRGDHELTGPISSSPPVIPNSFNGRSPVQQASWTQPARISTAQKYPNSLH